MSEIIENALLCHPLCYPLSPGQRTAKLNFFTWNTNEPETCENCTITMLSYGRQCLTSTLTDGHFQRYNLVVLCTGLIQKNIVNDVTHFAVSINSIWKTMQTINKDWLARVHFTNFDIKLCWIMLHTCLQSNYLSTEDLGVLSHDLHNNLMHQK